MNLMASFSVQVLPVLVLTQIKSCTVLMLSLILSCPPNGTYVISFVCLFIRRSKSVAGAGAFCFCVGLFCVCGLLIVLSFQLPAVVYASSERRYLDVALKALRQI